MEVPVLDVIRRYQLACVPDFVNVCLVSWMAGLRPLVLMDRVATSAELMVMQAGGRRCVTCFCKPDQLGRVYVDSYPPYAAKDALHFMMHDLREAASLPCVCIANTHTWVVLQFFMTEHMEKFVLPSYYCEQVGFLHQMRSVYAWAADSSVLRDACLRMDIGHVIRYSRWQADKIDPSPAQFPDAQESLMTSMDMYSQCIRYALR